MTLDWNNPPQDPAVIIDGCDLHPQTPHNPSKTFLKGLQEGLQ